ncbi:hypothetical protein AB1I63_00680 [Streptococcus pneumoniae]
METSSQFKKARRFTCKHCGRIVTTIQGNLDKRTTFCSSICGRRYWRHPERRRKQEAAKASH